MAEKELALKINPHEIESTGGIDMDNASAGQTDKQNFQQQLLAEFNALRAEMIHRMGERHLLVRFSIAVLAAILAFSTQPTALLVYPILGLFLALGWAHNDLRIGEIGEYIRNNIEDKLGGIRWEQLTFESKQKDKLYKYILRGTNLSAGGIIVGTQIISLLVPLIQSDIPLPSKVWLRIDIGVILLTMVILFLWRKILYLKQTKIWRTILNLLHIAGPDRKRNILFVPNDELDKQFIQNERKDIKIVTPAILNEAHAQRLQMRGKSTKEEVFLSGDEWTHSEVVDSNKICESGDFIDTQMEGNTKGPFAISYATKSAKESFHYHKKHYEVYYSDKTFTAKYRLPGQTAIVTKIMENGGTVVFAPGVCHIMDYSDLTIVLEFPAVIGDRYSEEMPADNQDISKPDA